jgi:CheY-like chemotaxis protein
MPAPTCPHPELEATWPAFAGLTVLRALGTGGMASVFAARGAGHPGEVALKIIDPLRSGRAKARLLAEARAAIAVIHPGLVRCLDVGEHLGHPYLVMELLPGGDGDDLVRRHHARVPEALLLRLATEAAGGLQALHDAGVLHRDLKPSNILFRADGGACVGDFGLASVPDGRPGVTRAGYTVGTPEYMSPEQARAQPLDARSDLHGLGSTLYHIATGRPPFQGATAWAILGLVLSEPFPDVRRMRPDLSPGFADVLAKLTAKDRAERYPSARELLDDLELLRHGRAPIHAGGAVSSKTSGSDGGGQAILVVDDDALARRIYGTGLRQRGFAPVLAADGAAGLQLAGSQRIAAAVIDLVLPDMDGTEVVRRLRARDPRLPILVLSNAFDPEQLQAARQAGASDVLAKSRTPPSALAARLVALLPSAPGGRQGPPSDPAEALAFAEAALVRVQVLARRMAQADDRLLGDLAATARGFSAAAAAAGRTPAAELAAATEILLRTLLLQPERRGASATATVTKAADVLQTLLARDHPARPHRALAVDDESTSRVMLGAALDRAGVAHDLARNADEALAKLSGGGYDILLTDVVMDGMNGFQLAARVRALPGCADLPIIFVTGLEDFPAFFAAAAGAGVDLVAKPYPVMELAVRTLVLLASRQPAAGSVHADRPRGG